MKKKANPADFIPPLPPTHPRYDRSHPLLRELVDVHVDVTDNTYFDATLTRLPGLGEEISYKASYYRIIRVIHVPVDHDGRPEWGTHAYLDAELVPEEPHVPGQRQPRRKPA